MIIQNKTHYFSEYTKLYNAFPDADSFSCQSSKRMGYYQRLFFEYAYTRKVNGMCFYYTLTYNDSHIPTFYGKNCFSYHDIRYITNGSLSKILLRKYGSKLKYFCACEKGEGKGKRGLGNNPHYHFIFFTQPADDVRYPYVVITPQEFKDIIYNLWQGAPSTKYIHWQFAKFGHCQEGLFNGEVLSPEAFSYVGKYCIKEQDDYSREVELFKLFKKERLEADITNDVILMYYYYLRDTDSEICDKRSFFKYFRLSEFNRWRKSTGLLDKSLERFYLDYCGDEGQYLSYQIVTWFKDFYVDFYCNQRLSEYRNFYSGKCRMSKSLGEYGINFVMLVDGSPRITLNTKQGYLVQYPCLYYIRKLFYDVKKCPYTGNPLYYLNERGMKMKLDSLDYNIRSFVSKVYENISFCAHNDILISKSDSDLRYHNYLLDKHLFYPDGTPVCNYTIEPPKSEVLIELSSRKDLSDIIQRYAVYHFVYQYRSFGRDNDLFIGKYPLFESYHHDYSIFLRQSSYYLDFDMSTVYHMLWKSRGHYVSFSQVDDFKPYLKYFDCLDQVMNTVGLIYSDACKVKFADKSKHQQRVASFKYNQDYPFEQIVLCDDAI